MIEDITDADYLPPFRAKIQACVQEGDVGDALPEYSSPVTKESAEDHAASREGDATGSGGRDGKTEETKGRDGAADGVSASGA